MSKYYFEDYRTTNEASIIEENTISGSGGGGCFPAGTMVKTIHGHKPIEFIEKGELIVAYDKFGELDFALVSETHIHKKEEFVDDIYHIFANDISIFPEGITGNHAVYDHTTNEHKEIAQFNIGDSLIDLEGNLVEITSITVTPNEDINYSVYNLTVEPQHTYFVGNETLWVKVHNGGGGKGGSARAAQEAANTLRSSSIAKVLEVYSHGEVEGIVGGAKGVYFNNTIVQNSDGTYNFTGITFDERKGTISQTYIPGFNAVEAELVLPGAIIDGTGVIEQLPDSNVQAARVTLRLPEGLWLQNTSNGDLNGYSVSYVIYTKNRTSSTWNAVVTKTITGKTTSPYEISHRVSIPTGATLWDIKVVRTSAVDTLASQKSVLVLSRITEITEEISTYNKIAYVGITIPANSVGNQIPARGYDVMGIKCQIPFNYDPVLRTYGASYWTGAFKTAWTDNPAWILYDLITSTEYGVANFLGQTIEVDIWAFYEASLYNDCVTWTGTTYTTTLISDGNGGFERRYLFNGVISTQQDAWQLLHAVASNMRAVITMKGNQISLIQDKPKIAKKIINNSNVLDGLFVYSGTESTSRATAINCTFNDKKDRYLPRTISEQDNTYITKFGYNVKDIIAYGCVTESQARRMAKWALYTETHQYDSITFSMSLNIIDLSVGDVISVMDDEYISDTNSYLTGRVQTISGTTVTLDVPVTLVTGHVYTFGVMSIDYSSIVSATIITAAGVVSTITLNSSLPAGDYTNHEFFCYSTGYIEPRQFLIQSITESQKGLYAITAIFYEAAKYAYIESGLSIPVTSYSNLIETVLPTVSTITFSDIYFNNGITNTNYIDVKWLWDETHTIKSPVTFSLRWRRDNNPYIVVNDIAVKNFQIPDTTPGVYDVYIEVVNMQGKRSLAAQSTYQYRTVAGTSTLVPPTNFFVSGTSNVTFTGTQLAISWDFATANSTKKDTLLDYVLEVWSSDGLTKKNTFVVTPDITTKGGKFTYLLQQNIQDFGTAQRNIQLKVYSRDTIGDVSIASTKTFTNAVPGTQSFTVISGVSSVFLNVTTTPESDVTGYQVYRSVTPNFTPGVTSDALLSVYDGPDTYITLNVPDTNTWYYKVAAYDSFSKTGLNFSSQQSSAALSVDATKWSLSGITFSIGATNRIDWTAGSIVKNGSTTYTIAAGNATWTTGTLYVYFNPTVPAALQTTTTLATAVAAGVYPLATYDGGDATHIKGGDGSAFISGSQLIAGTVGASQLVAGTAVITGTAQLGSAVINDVLTSTNFNATNHTGWNLNRAGDITTYGTLKIMDSAGNVVLSSGSTTSMDFSYIGGTTKPANNATVGANFYNTYSVSNAAFVAAMTVTTGVYAATYTPATGNLVSSGALAITASATNILTTAVHGLTSGIPVLYSCVGTTISGLVTNTTYYVVVVTATTFKLATTYANATAAVPVVITLGALTVGSTYAITGNKWYYSGYSTASLAATGGAKVTFIRTDLAGSYMIGLSTAPLTNNSYASIDFAICLAGSQYLVYENGVNQGSFGYCVAGDNFAIIYNGALSVNYYINGINFYSTVLSTAITLPIFVDTSLASSNTTIHSIGFDVYVAPTLISSNNVLGKIHPGNASTFIANAAIGTAQITDASITNAKIANLAVQTAQIADLSVNTLKIAGNAVSYITKGNVTSLSVLLHGPSSVTIIGKAYQDTGSSNGMQLKINGTVYDSSSLAGGGGAVGATTVVQTTYNCTTTETILITLVQTGSGSTNTPVINVLEVLK